MQQVCGLNSGLFEEASGAAREQFVPHTAGFELDTACSQLGCLRQYCAKLRAEMLTVRDCLGRSYLQLALAFAGVVDRQAMERNDHVVLIRLATFMLTLVEQLPRPEVGPLAVEFANCHLGTGNCSLNSLLFMLLLSVGRLRLAPVDVEPVVQQLEAHLSFLPEGVPLTPLFELAGVRGAVGLIKKILSREQDSEDEDPQESTMAMLARYEKEDEDEFEDAEYDCKAEFDSLYDSIYPAEQEPRLLRQAIQQRGEAFSQEVFQQLTSAQATTFLSLSS